MVRNSVRVRRRLGDMHIRTNITQRDVVSYLVGYGTLKHDEHEKSEQAVVPVLVQHPQRNAENLEYKERCRRMFPEKGSKGWNRDVELVLAVEREKCRCLLSREASRTMIRG